MSALKSYHATVYNPTTNEEMSVIAECVGEPTVSTPMIVYSESGKRVTLPGSHVQLGGFATMDELNDARDKANKREAKDAIGDYDVIRATALSKAASSCAAYLESKGQKGTVKRVERAMDVIADGHIRPIDNGYAVASTTDKGKVYKVSRDMTCNCLGGKDKPAFTCIHSISTAIYSKARDQAAREIEALQNRANQMHI